MSKRIKKPAVDLGKRHEWFRRHEEGESPQQIAKTVSYDVRTVRKQIDLERQEREKKEARTMVLRKALEDHYADLCAFAQKLDSQLTSDRDTLLMLKDDRMWLALREHLPRSIIWKSFDRWEELRGEITRLGQQFSEVTKDRAESISKSEFNKSPHEVGLTERMIEAVGAHARDAALGQLEILTKFDLHKISEDAQSDAVKLVVKIFNEASTWTVFDSLSRAWAELERVQRVLRDELAVINLRRVLPGRCRYCPI